MTVAIGAELQAGIRKGLVWGTPKVVGAGHGILILPANVKKDRTSMVDDSLGNYFPTSSDPAEIKAEGDIQQYLRFDGVGLLIATLLGSSSLTYTTPVVTGTATGGSTSTLVKTAAGWTPNAYAGKFVRITAGTGIGQVRKIVSNDATSLSIDATDGNWTTPDATSQFEISDTYATHVYDIVPNIDGLFLTYCINNKVNIEEMASLKPTSMTIKGETGKPVTITFKCIAYDKVTNSATNTLVTFAAVTIRETANRVLMSQGVIRMNTQSGAALSSGDAIYPKSFELTFTRKMQGDYGSGSSYNNVDEPTNDGLPTATLKMEFPKYTSNQNFLDWDTNTPKKIDFTFTGAGSRSILIQIPNAMFANVDLPVVAGRMKHPVDFNLLAAAAAPTGMTGVTMPFRITMVNTYCGDPLQIGN